MFSLPHLIEDDIAALDAALGDFIERSGSRAAILTDRGGFLITQAGDLAGLDTTTLGALAANSFAATQALAGLLDETGIASVYQEGRENSALIASIEDYALLIVLFPAAAGVGVVKYYTGTAVKRIAAQFGRALDRAPGSGLDLSALDVADTGALFRSR